jgi:hypothetical protein
MSGLGSADSNLPGAEYNHIRNVGKSPVHFGGIGSRLRLASRSENTAESAEKAGHSVPILQNLNL